MHGGRRVTERTPLTRPVDSTDYIEFASLLRTRRSRVKQFQCCVCATLIVIFTMALVVTISYSVSNDTVDGAPNLTSLEAKARANLSTALKLGFAPGSGSYTLFSNTANAPGPNSIVVTNKKANFPMTSLTDGEFQEGVLAGQRAIEERLSADAFALASPLPFPSPESRHRYAVSTCKSAGKLALAAVGEIAATKKIESSRSILDEPSSIGSFFNGGWLPEGMCKELLILNCTASKYRSFDGSCNRPMQWGASMMPYRRVLAPNYANGIDTPRMALSGKKLPSAREISIKVHKPSPSSNPAFTVMLAVYGQFLDHDITATALSQGINGSSISCCPPSVGHPECYPVPVGPGDPVFEAAGRTCMEFVRSAPAPQCRLGPREQLNQVTAFIDGSAIYGSDIGTARSLREFAGGRLRMQVTPDNRTLLPPSTNPNDGCNSEAELLRGRYCFAAGDARANENLHLTTMHLLWARQHNRIVQQLAKLNPVWSDEKLYEEARRIVGAQLQHITYQEFLPIVLGEREMNLRGMTPLTSGYRNWTESPEDTVNNPAIANNFATAAFRFAHTLLPGLMRVTDEQAGTSSYVELHRMLFNPYSLYAEGGVKSSIASAAGNVIQMTSTHVTSQLTNHLFEDPVRNVTVPCGLDLVSLNIQRGRDHGLPGYTRWREYCGLGKPEAFSDLEGHLDPQVLEEISMLYESVHDIDLYTGALAELPKAGGIVGPTFNCLIAEQFSRLQRGDRFWYEVPNRPHSFTEGQLLELRKTSLAKLICDCADDVTQIQAMVMRSVGPENPMLLCEDIQGPSFESFREDKPAASPKLGVPPVPFDWLGLKTNINSTIQEVLNFINSTAATASPITTDWLAFRNEINNTFADFRNQLADLHPPKPVEASALAGSPTTSFILRAVMPTGIYQDWINFKIGLLNSLNNSIGTIGGGPTAAIKWITFKQNITDQFAALKNEVGSVKTMLAPKMLMEKYKQEQAALEQVKKPTTPVESAVMLRAIFDWKNFKDDIISSLDDAILSIGDSMPPPGDPAWMSFGADIKDRFAALRNKINSETSTPPTELAATGVGPPPAAGDWLSFKADIIRTVNDAVQKIENGMPPPGDPAWLSYRDEIMKSFATFNTKPVAKGAMPTEFAAPSAKPARLGIAPFTKLTFKELSNLTNDWMDFRAQINDSLTNVIQDIQNKKPTTIDPLGWAAFKVSTMNDFAQLKNEIINIKGEWVAKINEAKSEIDQTNPPLPKADNVAVSVDPPKFDYTTFLKPVIPPEDWVAFKKDINDTVFRFLQVVNSTNDVDFSEIHDMFNKSFTDLRNNIASLKDFISEKGGSTDFKLVPTSTNNTSAAQWINFRNQLNSTIGDLVGRLKNETQASVAEMMKIMFETQDKLSDMLPPLVIPPADWVSYVSGVNKTVSDTLKNVTDLKHLTLMLRAAEPLVSSSYNPTLSISWLIVQCAVAISPYFYRY